MAAKFAVADGFIGPVECQLSELLFLKTDRQNTAHLRSLQLVGDPSLHLILSPRNGVAA